LNQCLPTTLKASIISITPPSLFNLSFHHFFQQMRRSGNKEENKRIIMDLEVVLKCTDYPFIVQCTGCFITAVSNLPFYYVFVSSSVQVLLGVCCQSSLTLSYFNLQLQNCSIKWDLSWQRLSFGRGDLDTLFIVYTNELYPPWGGS
jgi:hypothetical protein